MLPMAQFDMTTEVESSTAETRMDKQFTIKTALNFDCDI